MSEYFIALLAAASSAASSVLSPALIKPSPPDVHARNLNPTFDTRPCIQKNFRGRLLDLLAKSSI